MNAEKIQAILRSLAEQHEKTNTPIIKLNCERNIKIFTNELNNLSRKAENVKTERS